eukprot:XP_001692561.1 predicted protein [Chlamydomonas reinhardtii]
MPPSKKKGGKAPKEPAADGAPVSAASAPARARSSLAEFEEWMTKAGITWDTSVISLRAGDGDAAGKAQPATPEAPCGLRDVLRAERLGGGLALVAAVMYEAARGPASKWHGYLRSLPAREYLPVFWSARQLQQLAGTDLADKAEEDRASMAADFSTHLAPLLSRYPGRLGHLAAGWSLEAFMHAASWVASRAFYVDDTHGDALVPLADVFNHKAARVDLGEGSGWSAGFVVAEQEGVELLDIVAAQPLAGGTEVYNTYGEHSNAELVNKYGFALPYNAFDEILLDKGAVLEAAEQLLAAAAGGGKKALKRRTQFLEKFSDLLSAEDEPWLLLPPRHVNTAAWAALRVLAATEAELGGWAGGMESKAKGKGKKKDADNGGAGGGGAHSCSPAEAAAARSCALWLRLGEKRLLAERTAGVHTSSRFPPPPPSDPLIQTIHLSDILPVVRCVNPVEAQFVHKHVFFGRIGGYGLKQLGLCVRPGDTVVDVGSNIGNFAMWLLKELQGDVRLVVVEPVPPLAACLAANVQQYSVPGLTHASVVNAGCTSPDKSGRPALLSFNPGYTLLSTADRFSGQELDVMAAGLQRYTGREDRSELEGVVQSHLAGPEVREVAAAMACLSQVLEAERRPGLELQQIDLLKIDAVKSEWDILQGISDTDWARVRQAVIEVHLGGDVSRLDKVVNLLKAKGFANVRTGWPGTPTFLAYKQYGMMKASASARDAAALAA